jgi:hypothetical protein
VPVPPLREWLYLGAILVIVLGLAWWHHSAVLEGEAKVQAADARAVLKAQQAAEAQKEADAQTATEAVGGLQHELQDLRDHPPPPRVVRLRCDLPSGGPSSPPSPSSSSTESRPPASGGISSLPGPAPDVGPGLQRLALACDELSAEHRALLLWARKVSQ